MTLSYLDVHIVFHCNDGRVLFRTDFYFYFINVFLEKQEVTSLREYTTMAVSFPKDTNNLSRQVLSPALDVKTIKKGCQDPTSVLQDRRDTSIMVFHVLIKLETCFYPLLKKFLKEKTACVLPPV